MRTFDPEIPAIFPSHAQAADAVHELVSLGLADEYLERSLSGAVDRVVEDDAERAVFRAAATGVAIGAVLGCILGAVLVYAAQLVAGVTPAWSSAIAAGLGGSLAGIFLGSVFGAASRSARLEQRDRWSDVEVRPGEVLVVTHGHGWDASVRQIFEEYGGHPPDHAAARAA